MSSFLFTYLALTKGWIFFSSSVCTQEILQTPLCFRRVLFEIFFSVDFLFGCVFMTNSRRFGFVLQWFLFFFSLIPRFSLFVCTMNTNRCCTPIQKQSPQQRKLDQRKTKTHIIICDVWHKTTTSNESDVQNVKSTKTKQKTSRKKNQQQHNRNWLWFLFNWFLVSKISFEYNRECIHFRYNKLTKKYLFEPITTQLKLLRHNFIENTYTSFFSSGFWVDL